MKKKVHSPTTIFSISLALILLLTSIITPGLGLWQKSATPSYIVQGQSVAVVGQLVTQYGGQVTSNLDVISGVGAILPGDALARLLNEPAITRITPNAAVEAAGNIPATDYPEVAGAHLAWEQGITGEGVTVAVVDTGISKHKGLKKDIYGEGGRIIGWADFVKNKNNPKDKNGHGTHVAGIIANSQTGEDGNWNGVAPGVNLVGVRVLDKNGYGTYEQVIQGIQWVIENKDEYNIRVMNLSLVALVQSPYWADPLNQAVTQAWAEGITVIVAAGNSGPDPMTVGVPGNNPYVITVGAFTDDYTPEDWTDDYLAPFSAAGPSLDGFVKPDIIAPGAHMVSSMKHSSTLAKAYPDNQFPKKYFSMAGTSQAAAVVSGIAALTLSHYPTLTPDQVKHRIVSTALIWMEADGTDALYSIWQQGAGRVNAYDSVFSTSTAYANANMDIWADLAGTEHYAGYTYYDETTGEFKLLDNFGFWSGEFGAWSGEFGAWSGEFGAWSGEFGAWSGEFGAWSGEFGAWSGGYTDWAGGVSAWDGDEPWAIMTYAEASFVNDFITGISPDTANTAAFIGAWIDEQ